VLMKEMASLDRGPEVCGAVLESCAV
jgi:hypothetical protein